jgi:hypothetical protein
VSLRRWPAAVPAWRRAAPPTPALGIGISLLLGSGGLDAATAMMISDDDVRLDLGMQLQTRVERSTATDTTGGDWDAVDARPGEPEDLDWSIRRARLVLAGSYGTDYQFNLTLAADQVDTTGADQGRTPQLYRAWVERQFFAGSAVQTIHAGLDYPFFNRTDATSKTYLFPMERASAALMTVRGVGGRYQYTMPNYDLGIDVMESLDPAKPVANAGRREGMFYSARLEVSPLDGPKPSYQESWAGQPGQAVLLAADVGYDNRDLAVPGVVTSRVGYGIEALGHFDELSVLAELRFLRTTGEPFAAGATATATLRQRVFVIQGGYTFPSGELTFEPAVRLQIIDLDTGIGDQPVTYDGGAQNPGPDAEWGDSGRELDLGLNCYLHGHSNKLQLSYSRWEAIGGAAYASIWRLQHQLAF